MGNGQPNKELNRFLMELVSTLVSVIEQKDRFLRGHSERVANLCVGFARSLPAGVDACVEKLYFAGLLHDIGMVYMPIELVQKPAPLTRDELVVIRQHPVISETILSHLSIVRDILPAIRHHHEACNGSGYPDGLRGAEIPQGARILALADGYDAMVSPRAHRAAMSPGQALEEIYRGAGKQYDRKLVDAFVAFMEQERKSDGAENPAPAPVGGAGHRPVQEIIVDIVQRFKKGSIDLPVLPNVVEEIDRIVGQPSSTIEDLSRVVEKDAVISLRLISAANSPVYRGIEEIRTLRQAIPRLGIKETRNVVQAIVNRSLYRSQHPQFKRLMEKLWLHALASAYGARELARRLYLPDVDKLFLMGLVHDIGKVLLVKTLSEVVGSRSELGMAEVVDSIQQMHCSFGAALLRRWSFENDFVRVVSLHEGPDFAEQTEPEILVVNVANRIAQRLGYSLFPPDEVDAESPAAGLLGLEAEVLDGVAVHVRDLMADAAEIF